MNKFPALTEKFLSNMNGYFFLPNMKSNIFCVCVANVAGIETAANTNFRYKIDELV